MLQHIRKLVRRVLPRLRDPLLDGAVATLPADAQYAEAYASTVGASSDFVAQRYAEGQRWRSVLAHFTNGGKILDVGGADGAIELAFAADPRWFSVSIEYGWNDTLRRLRDATRANVRRIVADAARLPFRDGAFDAVTCLETIEHLRDAPRVASEIARVTSAGATLLVTTPPRLRFALRRDPHFDIRGLLLLPTRLQRRIAQRRGFTRADHFVDRIYTSAVQIARLFRGFDVAAVLSRSRAPRRWFWDAILLRRHSWPLDRPSSRASSSC